MTDTPPLSAEALAAVARLIERLRFLGMVGGAQLLAALLSEREALAREVEALREAASRVVREVDFGDATTASTIHALNAVLVARTHPRTDA